MSKRASKWLVVALLAAVAGPVMGQEGERPARGEGERQGPPPRRAEGPPMQRPEGPPPHRLEGGPGAPGRPEGAPPRPPMGEASSPQVRAMMGYLQLVEQYKQLTQDPTAAGVAAVVTAGDILRPRGAQAAIEYFEKQLGQVTSEPVKNAIRLQLADFYRASGSADKALEHLSALMATSAGGTAGVKKAE